MLALDLETQWLESLQTEIIEVLEADITKTELPPRGFDLVTAQMLLLHLPDPAGTCRELLKATASGGHLVIHDADFTALALQDSTPLEAAGLAIMTDTMRAAGVHLALGPKLESLFTEAGARIDDVTSAPGAVADRGAADAMPADLAAPLTRLQRPGCR